MRVKCGKVLVTQKIIPIVFHGIDFTWVALISRLGIKIDVSHLGSKSSRSRSRGKYLWQVTKAFVKRNEHVRYESHILCNSKVRHLGPQSQCQGQKADKHVIT